ncbi:sensor histidine kinase [Umezawaea beigongshangensis]|uniref:sensor histidine kinase n=1 Tax=Umezawaea beigongshangensis TaxID=2780383 RepID=UPI0018F24A7E|nr:sensor histidine kinase [Umezawaea beigongshangensis]
MRRRRLFIVPPAVFALVGATASRGWEPPHPLVHLWITGTFALLALPQRYRFAVVVATAASAYLYHAVAHQGGPLVLAPLIALFVLRRDQVVERRRARQQEERARIAREVHDVVAHSLAMINVQAGVAAHVADRRPEEAVTALLAIKEASRTALVDLRAALGMLRSGDGTSPVPGLARLSELIGPVGLPVEVRGEPGELPAHLDATAYRIVQEALTNVVRHARGATRVTVAFDREDDVLRLTVSDDGTGAGDAGPGNGVRGMRERVEAVGGVLDAGGFPGGGFRVRAVLPVGGAR